MFISNKFLDNPYVIGSGSSEPVSYGRVPNLFGIMDQFHGRHFFFHGRSGCVANGFKIIQAHYIYCELYFYYYYVSTTSDHQTLEPRGWRPLF